MAAFHFQEIRFRGFGVNISSKGDTVPLKVSIFGAGSVVFSLGLVKDLCLTRGLEGTLVSFTDIDEERLDVIHKLGERYAQDLGASLTFEATRDREVSLKDADFVINTATVTHNEYFHEAAPRDD